MSRNDLEYSTASPADRLLHLLKTRGPQLAGEAGVILGTTGEAVRQQCVKLAASGLVEARSEARGVGRPTQVWQLTAAGHARFPDGHSELTVQLLQTVRETFGEDAIERLIGVREQQTLALYQREMDGAADLKARVERLVALRGREGYMAEYSEQPDGALVLVENHCPICAAATACQGFCRAELQVFEQVLRARVERVEHILLGARRCAYRITAV
ncbi:transcriptional regulator [Pseudomonas gingeri]|nr:transcriptional regulator [Pseudomonas gingeri]NWA12551.1 transcriptional regulator [Pseudomonas gingeri]NWA58327.1 transcriptional regulator [Pseudomonas gingeri]NWA98187.1 transcriptional regulator [Pseudomonas gingeri]NWB04671.1 transcriptional regulator [Pseudomonas gingeri]